MWLENSRQYGLIRPFDRIELPPLTIVIGLNGAGKSQLLRGIAEGKITSPISASWPPNEKPEPFAIALLTNSDPDPEGLIKSKQVSIETVLHSPPRMPELARAIDGLMKMQQQSLCALEAQVTAPTRTSPNELTDGWRSFLTGDMSHGSQPFNMVPSLRQQAHEAGVRLRAMVAEERNARHRDQSGLGGSINVHDPNPERWLTLSRAQIASAIGSDETELFAPALATIFMDYRNRRWRNQVQMVTDQQDNTSQAYSFEEFEQAYGPPPWNRVTAALQSFGLPYSVEPPPSEPLQPVSFRLIRDGTSTPLVYQSLSSGERVLLRMVLASFQASDDRYVVHTPKLVLLDELDASLHPDNVRRWLAAIETGYVDHLGISCILTTHSPTTVALAPEGAIFEITAEDTCLAPITKQHAIDRLTAGLPMLAIDYSARRQVFTESTIDVDHYSRLHDLMRPRLPMDRTLSFVGTGTQGGCDFVYAMVGHMAENGNQAVFGIVDWDLKNMPTDRVKVIADSTHYAKDNVLLDPLLIGGLLLKNDELPLDPPVRYSDLRDAPVETLQRVSDAIVNRIKFPHAASKELALNYYSGGMELRVRQAFQQRNGHEIEGLVKDVFPMLKSRYAAEGALITALIKRVIADYPEFCPKPVTDLLLLLAND